MIAFSGDSPPATTGAVPATDARMVSSSASRRLRATSSSTPMRPTSRMTASRSSGVISAPLASSASLRERISLASFSNSR